MFGASLGPRLSPIFHLHLFSCVFLSLPLWSFSSFKSFWYIHMHRYWKRNSPHCWKSLISGWWSFLSFQFWVSVTGISCFCTWPQTAVFLSEPPSSWTSPDGLLAVACRRCSSAQRPLGVCLHLPSSFFRAPVKTSFLRGTLVPAACAFSFHELFGPRVTSVSCPLVFLMWVFFVFMSSLDCKLGADRDWVLLTFPHFGLQSLTFSLGDSPFPPGCL